MIVTKEISLKTNGNGDFINITNDLERALVSSEVSNGILNVFIAHTTCGLTIMEYEPGLIADFQELLEKLAPADLPYAHNERWGDGNGFAHLRASLVGTSLNIPFSGTKLLLGTWQQVVLIDFDNRPRERRIILQLFGD